MLISNKNDGFGKCYFWRFNWIQQIHQYDQVIFELKSIRNNPYSSGHNEGILDILIDPMNPLLNQYYIQLKKYHGHHDVLDQNENQMNRWHSRKQLELVARKYVMENGSKNDSKLTRRKKYIRTMRRIQK